MTGSTATLTEAPLPKPEGLEGVVAASTALSHVFGEEGRLVYRGYDIHELANDATFEEVAYLLWVGHLPTESELVEFQAKLDASRALPDAAIEVLRQLPATAQPMDVLRTGISSVGPLLAGRVHRYARSRSGDDPVGTLPVGPGGVLPLAAGT